MMGHSTRLSGAQVVIVIVNAGTGDWLTGQIATSTDWPIRRMGEAMTELASTLIQPLADPEPLFGWYNIFRPRHQGHLPSAVRITYRHRRPQARACRLDRTRWKRRRFLHWLRRTT